MKVASETDIIQHRHTAENFNLLKGPGNAQTGPHVRFEFVDIFAFERNVPLFLMIKTVDTIHHNGLSRSVGPDDRMDFALANFQAHSVQCMNLAEIHVNVF